MHELSLLKSMVDLIQDEAVRQNFSHVRVVWLEVGCLAGVEPDALRFCFDAVANGTVAQGAKLEIVLQPGMGRCATCGTEHPMHSLLEPCPQCGADLVQVRGANRIRVRELDVI